MDIFSPTIRCFLYIEDIDVGRVPLTAEFDYRWNVVRSNHFQRDRDLRESPKRWNSQYVSIDGEGADLVTHPRSIIKKANFTFQTKFF